MLVTYTDLKEEVKRNVSKNTCLVMMKDELIKTQAAYIKFLDDYISGNAVFLSIHHVRTSEEDVRRDEKFRDKIKFLNNYE